VLKSDVSLELKELINEFTTMDPIIQRDTLRAVFLEKRFSGLASYMHLFNDLIAQYSLLGDDRLLLKFVSEQYAGLAHFKTLNWDKIVPFVQLGQPGPDAGMSRRRDLRDSNVDEDRLLSIAT